MNLESTSGDQIPFSDPDAMFAGFTKEDVIELAYISGDFMLAVDDQGVIRDIAKTLPGSFRVPHRRGGDPYMDASTSGSTPCSPQAWG